MKHRLSRFSKTDVMIFEVESKDDSATSDLLKHSRKKYIIVENENEVPLVIYDGQITQNAWVTQDHLHALEAKAVSEITGEKAEDLLRSFNLYNALEIYKNNPEVV